MKIISLNCNGIRAAARKGFFPWLAQQQADVVCVQELKANDEDIAPELRSCGNLRGHFFSAQRKGYSGVGVYSNLPEPLLQRGFGVAEFDNEGRYLALQLPLQGGGVLHVVSMYAPSGSAGEERQASKELFMAVFLPHLKTLLAAATAQGDHVLLCGDWNIAHQKEDLKNWRGNQKNSGFLPHEREWLTQVLALGLVDVFRQLHPLDNPDNLDRYTWWSARGAARESNVGWRIDYQLATPGLAGLAQSSTIYKDPIFSDHAALAVEYQLPLAS